MPRSARANASEEDTPKLKPVDSHKGEGYEIRLLSDDAALEAFVEVEFSLPDAGVTSADVMRFLANAHVTVAADARAALTKAFEARGGSGKLGPLRVARGKEARPGADGKIDWFIMAKEAAPETTTTGRVDYRERNAIINVRQGDKILRIVPPTDGTAGADVFGNPIPSQSGRPVAVRKGKNVEATPDGAEFFAQAAGKLETTGDVVSVEPNLVVQGNVDLTVGNIDFIGPVRVNGDVLEGFRVTSGKEIEVTGMVEAADLEAGEFIRVGGGVTGKGKASVACKGTLEARYLNEACVEAGGDVVVANSIVNSTVKSRGKVIVNSGGIRGSQVVAQKGLKCPELGSDMGVRTIIVAGVDYDLKDQLVNVEREIGVIRETVERIEKALGPLLADGAIITTLPPAKAGIARKLMVQMDMLMNRSSELAGRRDALNSKMAVASGISVEVARKIYPGVVMQIGNCRRTFELDVTGPLRLFPDVENASIRVSR